MKNKFKYINNESRFAFGFEPEFMNSQNSDYDLRYKIIRFWKFSICRRAV